ncbi:MAG: hypothetical protein NUV53_01455 [Patescibacteria group bacterium]|nr:hypothetical protein [Patescibacteria group bacterium]
MNPETQTCQSCKSRFVIEPDDFAFYEKIKVPPPTWCPECRLQRRLSFCNERHLYKNACGLCRKDIVSMYSAGTVFPVYCLDCYRSDRWDPLSHGAEYDFSKPFFEQFKELKLRVPRAERVIQGDPTGNAFCNRASYNKNSYLLVRANYNENSRYSYNLWDCRDSADCFNAHKSELSYQCVDVAECYNVQYCQECRQCRDSLFLFDCRNCMQCAGCAGLRNKQYYILNRPYTKEEYEREVQKLRLHTHEGRVAFAERFGELLGRAIHEPAANTNCVNSSGNWLIDCKDVKNSYQSRKVENGKNLLSVIESKDCMDYSYWGRGGELIYETANCGYNSTRIRFVNESWDACHDLTYCDNCYASANLFGCVGMRKKEYCILNRQYAKEEYEKLIPKIIEHMNVMPYADSRGIVYRFGEFFPPELSASAYNTTAAYDYFPLARQEVLGRRLLWEDVQEKKHVPTLEWKDVPDESASVKDDIIKEVILCQAWGIRGDQTTEEHNCTKAFRITAEELSFYRRMNIPIPRECPNTRHFARFKKRNPPRLWRRHCMCNQEKNRYKNTVAHSHGENPCPNEFETSYAPDQSEIVYCENCYHTEVA